MKMCRFSIAFNGGFFVSFINVKIFVGEYWGINIQKKR